MAKWRNKRKIAAVSRETPEDTRSSRAQNVLDPELTQDYISQVSEEIEGRETKKLSKEFSKTKSRILGALSKLDELLLNPQVQTCSVAVSVPGTSRKNNWENREITGDRSSDYPCPEVAYFFHHFGHLNSPEAETYPHMVTRVQEEIRNREIALTWWQEFKKKFAIALTWRQKLKDSFPTAPLVLRRENKRRRAPRLNHKFAVRIPLQQLKQTRFCWPFKKWRRTVIQPISTNNISRISKLPKSLTTTMPTFDGKSQKFELFADLFQASLKIHNQLTEGDKINYFHSLMRGDALQVFKNITSPNWEKLREVLTVFRRRYVKPQSRAMAKHKF